MLRAIGSKQKQPQHQRRHQHLVKNDGFHTNTVLECFLLPVSPLQGQIHLFDSKGAGSLSTHYYKL